jgi:integrase
LTRAISRFFSWAIEQGLIESNPAIGLTDFKVPARTRVLSLDELRAVWLAAPANDFGRIIRLLMLTGAREAEIAKLHRAELQGDALLISGTRTKNHRELHVPLAASARAILDEQIKLQDPDRELLFGRRGSGPFGDWAKSKLKLDATIAAQRGSPLTPWRLHDLRRSFTTHLNELGIAPPHVVEALVGHQTFKPGVSAAYNYATYAAELRTAALRWADHLLSVVEGKQSNVTPLRQGA